MMKDFLNIKIDTNFYDDEESLCNYINLYFGKGFSSRRKESVIDSCRYFGEQDTDFPPPVFLEWKTYQIRCNGEVYQAKTSEEKTLFRSRYLKLYENCEDCILNQKRYEREEEDRKNKDGLNSITQLFNSKTKKEK